MNRAIELAERGLVPDALIRAGIRRLLHRQLAVAAREPAARRAASRADLRARLAAGPITIATGAANAQHYEVPSAWFRAVLGPRMKYSACLWPDEVATLAEAEESMLDLTCRRARLDDGMAVLDLGCGWGSLTLWIAERYPRCRVLAVSNSAGQRAHIEAECARRGFRHVTVVTADIAAFEPGDTFDRVISIEMLEHVRNHTVLFERIARWIRPGGSMFTHVFAHRELAYLYETDGEEAWMARHFFTGGMMPSEDWLATASPALPAVEQWRVSGLDYHFTLEAWLSRLDTARDSALEVLVAAEARGGAADASARTRARLQLQRWRIFLLACSELFAWQGGGEWFVSHTRFEPNRFAR